MSSPENRCQSSVSCSKKETSIRVPFRALVSFTFSGMMSITAFAACCGVLSGIGGACLALILHWVQHVAYGYSLDRIIGPESFLQGVSNAAPLRRLFVLCVCGSVAGFGWYGLARYGRRLVPIRSATDRQIMPLIETVIHALLQIVTVALGSPLGREVAPRELGALLAQRFLIHKNITADQYRILISCGAGAGLAAVYNVPIAGTVFIMEVMLKSARTSILLPAAVASFSAAFIARSMLGDEVQYMIPSYEVTLPLIVVSAAMGPVFGAFGFLFRRVMAKATLNASPDLCGVVRAIGVFAALGILAMKVPALLGNGKGPAELAFTCYITPTQIVLLLAMKLAMIALTLRVGAKGGLLTPGLSVGALLGLLLGGLLAHWFPEVQPGALALIGAASFLSSSMVMPVTAACLVMEFTNAPLPLAFPVVVAITGSELTRRWLASAGTA